MKIYKLTNSDYIYFIQVDTNEKYPSLKIHHKDGYETRTENFLAKIETWLDKQWIDARLAQALLDDFKLGALPTIECNITTDYIVNTVEPGSQNTVSSDYLLPTFDEIREMQPLLPRDTNYPFTSLEKGLKVHISGRFSCKISNIICEFERNKDNTMNGNNDYLLTIKIIEGKAIFVRSCCYVSTTEKDAILNCDNLLSLAGIFEGKSNCDLAKIIKLEAKREESENTNLYHDLKLDVIFENKEDNEGKTLPIMPIILDANEFIQYIMKNKPIIGNRSEIEFFLRTIQSNFYNAEQEKHLLHSLEKALRLNDKFIKGYVSFWVGCFYILTFGSHRDIDKGLKYLEEAVALDEVDAMVCLGYLYEHGYRIPRDLSQAKTLYKKASDLNNACAMYHLGVMYEKDKEYLVAKELYEQAVERGMTEAMYAVGNMYVKGVGDIPKDFYKARGFYKQAIMLSETGTKFYLRKLAEFAFILRNVCLDNAEDASELKSLKETYPMEKAIQYQYVMALEPQNINLLIEKSLVPISECIVLDSHITDLEKYRLLSICIKFASSNNQWISPEVKEHHASLESIDIAKKIEYDNLEKAIVLSIKGKKPSVTFFNPASETEEELEFYNDSESCELIPFDDAQTLMVEKHKIAHFTFEFKTDESLFILLNMYSDEGHQAELSITNQNKEDIFGCTNLANLEDISSTIEDGDIILDLIAQYEESKVFSITRI